MKKKTPSALDKKAAPKTRKQQKEDTRNLVLNTARDLFQKQGYEKTTIRAIAKKAGIASGTALTHFPDKKELLGATMYADLEAALTRAMGNFPEGSDTLEILIHHFGAIFDYYGRRPALSRVLIKETLFSKGEWSDRIDSVRNLYTKAIEQMFEAMQAEGRIQKGSDCRILADGVMGLYFSVLVLGLKDGQTAARQTARFRQLVSSLLLGHLTGK